MKLSSQTWDKRHDCPEDPNFCGKPDPDTIREEDASLTSTVLTKVGDGNNRQRSVFGSWFQWALRPTQRGRPDGVPCGKMGGDVELLHGDKQEMGVNKLEKTHGQWPHTQKVPEQNQHCQAADIQTTRVPGGAPQETTGNESSPRAR